MQESDLWHFICEESTGAWTWRRLSESGEEVDCSDFSFQSFNVCVADAERSGFTNNTKALRRVHSIEPLFQSGEFTADGTNAFARRRRARPEPGADFE